MNKYTLDTDENRAFLKDEREELLLFGRHFPSPGGGSYYLGSDGTPDKDRPRETWITSRMLHVYSIGTLLGYGYCAELADEALRGLRTELFDDKNGGWYAGIRPDGSILESKQCYAHAFVILASSSAVLAGREGAEELLKEALEVYDRYFWNEEEGLSADTWDTEFKELSPYRGLNANMHTVEAFLAASDVTSDEKYRMRAKRIIDHVIGWAEENDWRIPEHFNESWEPCLYLNEDRPDDPFKPFGATPGHGIEWSRLIVQWALSACSMKEEAVKKYLKAALSLYERAVEDAWSVNGNPGLCYTTDWNGKTVVQDRMHWTLCEAINTSAVLDRVMRAPDCPLSGEDSGRVPAEDYKMFMKYLDDHVIDHDLGSWYHQLDGDNKVMGTVWPGKPDLYHAVQATLIPYVSDPGVSVAPAVRSGRIILK